MSHTRINDMTLSSLKGMSKGNLEEATDLVAVSDSMHRHGFTMASVATALHWH